MPTMTDSNYAVVWLVGAALILVALVALLVSGRAARRKHERRLTRREHERRPAAASQPASAGRAST